MKGISDKIINVATVSFPVTVSITSDVEVLTFHGNKTLAGNVVIQESATPDSPRVVYMLFTGAITTGANTFTVFGTALNSDVIKNPFICIAFYTNSVWTVWYGAMRTIPTHTGGAIEVGAAGGVKIIDDSITNAMINSAAAIDYSKLVLTNGVVNADLSPSAAIALSKLAAMTASRLVVSDAGGLLTPADTATYPSLTELAYLKGITSAIQTQLNAKITSGALLNADVNAAAAIVYSKLNLSGGIVNADVNAAAGIVYSKMAALTASEMTITNASGVIVSAPVATYPSLTELSYVKGLTSALQTQLNSKGGQSGSYTYSSTASITLNASATYYYKLNTTSNAIALTLPAANAFASGRAITVTQVFSGGATRVTVSPDGTDTIQGLAGADVASFVYTTTGETHVFLSNGTDSWLMLT